VDVSLEQDHEEQEVDQHGQDGPQGNEGEGEEEEEHVIMQSEGQHHLGEEPDQFAAEPQTLETLEAATVSTTRPSRRH